MRGESAREKCPKDILLTLLDGPKRFEELVDILKDKYSRGTINKYLNELFSAKKITREGRRGPYLLTNKGKEEAEKEAQKRKINKKIDEADPGELEILKQKISELEKELNYYKIQAKIQEYEEAHLPLTPVIKKLTTLGFKKIDHSKLVNYFQKYFGPFGKSDDDFSPDEIEIKLIPASEIEGFLTSVEVGAKYGPGWVILSFKPINGYYIIGAYKELLELYNILFEYEWLKWKEKFNLTDEDWKIVGPYVCLKMLFDAGVVHTPLEISGYLYRYTLWKKPNAFEELKRTYMKHFGKEEAEAEEQAKKTIKYFNELREKPINERWNEVEIHYLDEGSKRIFKYLKNKYAV